MLDLNGYIIKTDIREGIQNNGTFEITDTTEEANGTIRLYTSRGIVNNANANMTMARFNMAINNTDTLVNTGNLTINASNISSNTQDSSGINNAGSGVIEINNGEITATGKKGIAIYLKDTANLKVNSGIIRATGEEGRCIYNIGSGKVEILDGTISSNGNAIYNENSGNVTISGGNISTSNNNVLHNNASGNVTILGGTITLNNTTSNYKYVIYNNKAGSILLEGGNLVANDTRGAYSSGIYSGNTEGATVTLGKKDRDVSVTIPSITANRYGVYVENNATMNFYDGVIVGNALPIYGDISEVEEGYEIDITENKTKATLKIKDATVESVASVGNIYYDTIAEAINGIGETGTISIHKEIEQNTQIVIPAGKNITIDLQANEIIYENSEPLIVVEEGAILSIIDSYEDGTDEKMYGCIENKSGMAIKNQGIMYIGIDDDVVYANSPRIIGQSSAIENTGELHIYDGTISGEITGTGTVTHSNE